MEVSNMWINIRHFLYFWNQVPWWISILIFVLLCFAFFLIYKRYEKYNELLHRDDVSPVITNLMDIKFDKKLKDLFPDEIKNKLEKNAELLEIDDAETEIEKILNAYKPLFLSVIGYFGILFIYVCFTLIKIAALSTYVFYKSSGSVQEVATILGNIIIIYLWGIAPLSNNKIEDKLLKLIYDISEKFSLLSQSLFRFIFSFFILCIYFYVMCYKTPVKWGLSGILLALLFYQYLLLRLIVNIILKYSCKILKKILEYLLKHLKKEADLNFIEKSAGITYASFKNATYLSMVFIYFVAAAINKLDTVIPIAISILFLVDSYFVEEKSILIQYKKDSCSEKTVANQISQEKDTKTECLNNKNNQKKKAWKEDNINEKRKKSKFHIGFNPTKESVQKQQLASEQTSVKTETKQKQTMHKEKES